MIGCGSASEPRIDGLKGSVQIDSENAAPGTIISFMDQSNVSNSFTTIVGENGTYEYHPPGNIAINPGEFVAVVRPLNSKTVTDDQGMTKSVPIPGVPKDYGKYSDPQKSDLTVKLTPGQVTKFDIVMDTKSL